MLVSCVFMWVMTLRALGELYERLPRPDPTCPDPTGPDPIRPDPSQPWQEKWEAEKVRLQVLNMSQPASIESELSGPEKPLLGAALADQTPDHNA